MIPTIDQITQEIRALGHLQEMCQQERYQREREVSRLRAEETTLSRHITGLQHFARALEAEARAAEQLGVPAARSDTADDDVTILDEMPSPSGATAKERPSHLGPPYDGRNW